MTPVPAFLQTWRAEGREVEQEAEMRLAAEETKTQKSAGREEK